MEFISRYDILGIDYPDPAMMCRGQCEGTGVYPQHGDDATATLAEQVAWSECHARAHTLVQRIRNAFMFRRLSYLWERCDGYHFIKCPDCGGTGKA